MHRPALIAFAAAALATGSHAPSQSRSLAAPTGTVVASNMNDNTATIVDAASARVVATLPTGEGPHEVTISRDGKWAVVSNYGVKAKPGHTLTVIDVARASVARTIDLGTYQ